MVRQRLVNNEEITAVGRLTAERRCDYFVKFVADTERLFVIFREEVVLLRNSNDTLCIPIWPSREYADIGVKPINDKCKIMSVSIYKFVGQILLNPPQGITDLLLCTADQATGILMDFNVFCEKLKLELEKY